MLMHVVCQKPFTSPQLSPTLISRQLSEWWMKNLSFCFLNMRHVELITLRRVIHKPKVANSCPCMHMWWIASLPLWCFFTDHGILSLGCFHLDSISQRLHDKSNFDRRSISIQELEFVLNFDTVVLKSKLSIFTLITHETESRSFRFLKTSTRTNRIHSADAFDPNPHDTAHRIYCWYRLEMQDIWIVIRFTTNHFVPSTMYEWFF